MRSGRLFLSGWQVGAEPGAISRVVQGFSPRKAKRLGVPHVARKQASLPRKREKKARERSGLEDAHYLNHFVGLVGGEGCCVEHRLIGVPCPS